MHGVKRKEWTKELLRQKRLKDTQRIAHYRKLNDEILDSRDQKHYSVEALEKTKALLQLNPEFNSVWNYRRDTISALADELPAKFWENELTLTMDLLKRYPKVYWIWNHRLWCLEKYPSSGAKKWQIELLIVGKVLDMDARNFHGWHYRRIVVSNIETLTGQSMNTEQFDFTTKKINENISNFSAWHQRATLIPQMIEKQQISNAKEFVDQELHYIINAIYTDAEDQSVWFYIKWYIKNECIVSQLNAADYAQLLQQLSEAILTINEDELEFSGKDNNWCLKILSVIETIQKDELNLKIDSHSSEYLKKLAKVDPLRKNRYFSLLKQE